MLLKPRTSAFIRIVTLMLSVSVLALLVTQATLTSGCAGHESSEAKAPEPSTINPEPKPAAPAESASAPPLDLGGPHFGGSKSGALLSPGFEEKLPAQRQKTQPSNFNAQR